MSTSVEYELVLKNGQFASAAKESEKAIRDVGSATRKIASGISDEFASAGERIEFQKQIISDLEKKLKDLETAYKNAVPGNAWADAVNEFNHVKRELEGEKKALEELEEQTNKTEQSQMSLKRQLQEMKTQLVNMETAGQRGTEAYRQLQERAGTLRDAIADADAQMRIMAHDQRGFQGVISGLNGLTGAMSAAAGAAALFGTENENLQRVMLKVQSLMAITVGLQQVQAVLDKDSAFRLVVLNGLKSWWAEVVKKASAAETAETTALAANSAAMTANATATAVAGTAAATSAGFFRMLGTAIKSISGTGWVVAGLAAITSAIAAMTKKIRDNGKEQEEIHRKTAEAAAPAIAKLGIMRREWTALGDSLEKKKKYVEDNAEAFKELGGKVSSVEQAEKVLVENTKNVVDAMKARAMAAALSTKAQEKTTELLEEQAKLDKLSPKRERMVINRATGTYTTYMEDNPAYSRQQKKVEGLMKDIDNLYNAVVAKKNEINYLLDGMFDPDDNGANNTDGETSNEDNMDAAEKELIGWKAKYWKLIEERDKAIKEMQSHLGETIHFDGGDVTYDSETIEEEVRRIHEDFTKKAMELGEEYGLTIHAEVVPEADDTAYQQLLDEYADYMRKLANINKQYDEQLKTAGGDESLKDRINARRQQDIAALVMDTFKADEAIGRMAESISNLGKTARGAITDKLYKILQFAQNSRIKLVDTQSVKEFAELNGVSEELLNSLINNDAALEEFDKYVSDIGKQAKQIDTLKDAVDNYRKALDKAKSGKILDIDALEQAKGLLNDMIKALADNILDELNTIGDVMTQLGDLLGDDNLTTAGEFLNDFTSNIQAAEEGAQAWGGWWGAIIGGVSDLIPKIVKWMNAGTTKSLDDVEKMLSHTESMINYWREISNHSNWQANDYTQAFDTERIQELLDKIKQARKWVITDVADLGSSFLGRGWSVQKIKTLIESIKKGSNDITNYVNEIMGNIADGVGISSKEAFDKMMSSYDKRMEELQGKLEVLLRNPKKNAEEINELLILLGETAQEKIDALLEHAESVVGVTSQQLFDDLFGMISDAFDAGKDSIDDFASYFNKTIANMIKNQVLTRLLADRIQQYIEDIAWHYDEGHLTGENAADYINWLRGYGEEIVKDGLNALEALRPIFEGLSVAVDDAGTLSGSIKGITADQAGMLAGQMNAMRTAQLQQVSLLTEQLDALNNIGNNTRYIRDIYNYIRGNNFGNGNLNRAYGQS